jgi:acyl-coenzyme A synthetase/AMP-(fatty) acid ligase
MSQTLHSAWKDTVRSAPGAVAYIDAATGARVTRADLDANAMAWCALRGDGLAGRTVVLAEPNGADWLAAFIGLLEADAVIAPLDPGEPLSAQHATAAAIGATWIWSGGDLRPVGGRGRRARDGRRLVKLTSGSTGTPRAIAFTDAQMLADGRQVCAGMGIRPEDVNFGLIPFGHSYGLGNLVVPLLAQGTAIAGGAAVLPQAMAEAIARERPTVFPAVPALLRVLVAADIAPGKLASLRTVISAGAPLAPEVAAAFHAKFGRKVHSFYGSSETGGITYDRTGDAARTGRSVGAPLPGVELVFSRSGRVVVSGAAVFTLGNRRRDARGCGAYRTADIAAPAAGGELVLLGRAGRWVKISGRRLNLAEVERAMKAVPGVREAFVTLHRGRAEALAAAAATELAPEAVRTALAAGLAAWKVPKKLVCLAAFPLTARGKTDTAKLRGLLG